MKTTQAAIVSLRTDRKACKSRLRHGILATSAGVLVSLATMAGSSYGAIANYSNSGGSVNWGEAANWTGAVLPSNGDDLVFNNVFFPSTSANNFANPPVAPNPFLTNVNSITFGPLTGAKTLGGGALTIGAGGVTNNNAGTMTLAFTNGAGLGITLGAAQTWISAAGGLNVTAGVDTNGVGLIVNGAFNTAMSGVVTGAGSLTKNGTGTLTLSRANNYSGGTTANTGVLSISNGSALGAGTTTVVAGAELRATANMTLNNSVFFSGGGTISAATGTILTLGPWIWALPFLRETRFSAVLEIPGLSKLDRRSGFLVLVVTALSGWLLGLCVMAAALSAT